MKEKIRVLVIDDEPSMGQALKLILDDNGYETVVALTGRNGLEATRQQKFDITITDLHLPDMSGLEVLRNICKINPDSLGILITAHGTTEVKAEVIKCGGVGVLLKPFPPAEILGLITDALNKRDNVNH